MSNFNKKDIICFIVIVLIILIFVLIYNYFSKEEESSEEFLKNYDVNEYIPTYISDEEMAKIYFNDYVNKIYNNIEDAYNSLDIEYRDAKFGSLDNYKSYINMQDYTSIKIKEYYKTSEDGYIYYGVYDNNDNVYIFKTNGVLQYSLFLDDYTIELW